MAQETRQANGFAEQARLVKRDKLVAKMDAALVRDEINPLSIEAVHQVEDLTALGRAGFEMLAGVNAGSEATWRLVVELYRSRRALQANEAGSEPFRRLPSADPFHRKGQP